MAKQVVLLSEAWPSQKVSWCGEVKKMGAAKTIISSGIKVDRDTGVAGGLSSALWDICHDRPGDA